MPVYMRLKLVVASCVIFRSNLLGMDRITEKASQSVREQVYYRIVRGFLYIVYGDRYKGKRTILHSLISSVENGQKKREGGRREGERYEKKKRYWKPMKDEKEERREGDGEGIRNEGEGDDVRQKKKWRKGCK